MSHPRARRDQTRTLAVAADAAREALGRLERSRAAVKRSSGPKGPPVEVQPNPKAPPPLLRRRPLQGSGS